VFEGRSLFAVRKPLWAAVRQAARYRWVVVNFDGQAGIAGACLAARRGSLQLSVGYHEADAVYGQGVNVIFPESRWPECARPGRETNAHCWLCDLGAGFR